MTLPTEVQAKIEAYCNENGKIAEVNGYPVFAHFQLFDAAKFGYALANEWVSVEERLPEEVEVIVYFKNVIGWHVTSAVYKKKIGFIDNDSCEEMKVFHPYSVTHWMPLPQPPSK